MFKMKRFLSSSPRRCLFFVHTREREREREREKEEEREERAETTDENFVSTKYAKRVKKQGVAATAFLPPLEREREAQTHVYNHAVLSDQVHGVNLLVIIAY
mgnify:CR=1 FL=1